MYKLKSTIGRSYLVNPNDILPTKKNLQNLVYYDGPSYGMTEYPDEDMIQEIERFQKDNQLNVDGIMKPEGETETKFNQIVEARSQPRKKTPYTNCYPSITEEPQTIRDKFAQDFGKSRILQRRNILTFAMEQQERQKKYFTVSQDSGGRKNSCLERKYISRIKSGRHEDF